MNEALTEEQVEPFQDHPVAASIGQDFLDACIGLFTSVCEIFELRYSQRRAAMGSMAVARRAGMRQASAATAIRTSDTASIIHGSRVPLSIQLAISRFKLRLSASPTAIPIPTLVPADRATRPSTSRRRAPSATRTPSSLVRCRTV